MMKAFSPIVQLQIQTNNRPLQEYHKDVVCEECMGGKEKA